MPWITGNRYLNQSEMENNALLIRDFFLAKGWSINAISGMCGNMQTESTLNPGIWEGLIPGRENRGYGLVQWTPMTKYRDWAGPDWADNGPLECERIQYEVENNIQWVTHSSYPISFQEFIVSTETPYYLGMAFLTNYEMPADPDQPIRGVQAEEWYEFFGGTPPEPPTPVFRKLPFWMLCKRPF